MSLLDQIFQSKKVVDAQGKEYELKAHTSPEQCSFLQKIIADIKPKAGIEVGLAYGISTVAILESFAKVSSEFKYFVLDPFQQDWKDIGLENIKRSGLQNHVEFFNDYSDRVLPKLYLDGLKIQFAYIDSTKVFDILMVDAYYLFKMLDTGGVLVFDDVDFPGIRKLLRYLVQHPSIKVYKTFRRENSSKGKKVAQTIYKKALETLPFKERLIPNVDSRTDADLMVDYYCVALQKVSEDTRNWDWSVKF
jgi:predicted O-methyltransferase YrrM